MPRVVIVGGGFGGLYAARALRRAPVRLTLVDRRNFHLFQPLLYQVATGGLSPADISSPLRAVLKGHRHTTVLQADVVDLDAEHRRLILRDGTLEYDIVIVATGVTNHYFGRDEWVARAPSLKTIEDAVEIRRRVLLAFETAEREQDPARRAAWLTFVVVGGGPTGVELAGALGELARRTLRQEFRHFVPGDVRVILAEGQGRVLPTYDERLAVHAARALRELGVTVMTNTLVSDMPAGAVVLDEGGESRHLPAETVVWAAGVRASPLGEVLARRAGARLDRMGRVLVEPDLTLPDHPEILVIGDLAHFAHGPEGELPGVAPVAMQQGRYAAELIQARLRGDGLAPFAYRDKGALAVIGRNRAVAEIFGLKVSGLPAWLIWIFVHIAYLIEYDNKLLVLVQWAFAYFTHKRGARLIVGPDPFPVLKAGPAATDAAPAEET